MVRLPDQHIVGPCGKCQDCHAFSYDGPPHESKLISYRDYLSAPTVADAEGVRLATANFIPTSVKVHDHPLSITEIVARVKEELLTPIEVKFPTVDVSRRLRVPIEIHHKLDGTVEVIAPEVVPDDNAQYIAAIRDQLDSGLRVIAYVASDDPTREWATRYGTDYENETFSMARWRYGSVYSDTGANFHFKPLGFKVAWHRFIGNKTVTNFTFPPAGIARVIYDSLESLAHAGKTTSFLD